MKWSEFFETCSKGRGRDFYLRHKRWLGYRIAYVFYHLGITANVVSILRILGVVAALYFLYTSILGNKILPFVGFFLLYFQDVMDTTDGAISRVRGESSEIGAAMDAVVNDYARGGFVVVVALMSGNTWLMIGAVFVIFSLINFRHKIGPRLGDNWFWRMAEFCYRVAVSIPFMLLVMPLVLSVLNMNNINLIVFSYVVTIFYLFIAVLWMLLSISVKTRLMES